jgi:hypothetical protein
VDGIRRRDWISGLLVAASLVTMVLIAVYE